MQKKFLFRRLAKINKEKNFRYKKKKKIPILVGGTGLYFKALTDGLVNIPNIPIKHRKQIRLLYKKLGSKKVLFKINKIRPFSKR